LGVHHHVKTVRMKELEDEVPVFLDAMDQPTVDGFNTWFVSQTASRMGFKVVLSGLGGDELLGGYSTFSRIPHLVEKLSRWNKVPYLGEAYEKTHAWMSLFHPNLKSRNSGLIKYGGTYDGAYQLERGVFMPWQLHHIMDMDFARVGIAKLEANQRSASENSRPHLNNFGKVIEMESARYMRNQLLRDTDWAGMAHSLEIRVPLVDRILAEKIVGLVCHRRLKGGKSILPSVMAQELPERVTNRPKTGFTVPLWKWLRKSKHFDAWRRVKFLQKTNVRDCKRWAYCLVESIEELKGVIK